MKRRSLPSWGFVAGGFLVVSTFAARTRAESPAPAASPSIPTEIYARERPTTRSFYGWQILATGEAGGVVAAASTILPESPMKTLPATLGFLAGMPFYALGGPATHWTHGDFIKGIVSLSGNFLIPAVSGVIGQSVRCAPSDAPDDCGSRGFFSGFAIALVTVPIVDALVLGWEDIPDDDPLPESVLPHAPPKGKTTAFSLAPAWHFGPRGEFGLGVAGRF